MNTPNTTTDDEEFVILIEWTDSPSGIQKVSRANAMDIEKLKARTEQALNLAMGTIHAMAHRVTMGIQALNDTTRPDEVGIEFGINLDSEVGALVAKTSVGAQLKVNLKWNIETPDRLKILVDD